MSTLVAYYSQSRGNTRRIAEMTADALDADLDEIRTVAPYPDDYNTVVEQGKREVDERYLPPIEPCKHAPEAYDRIVIATPTWWYTMAPAVATYLSEHSWVGKIVVPLQTHGGWPGQTIGDIENACAGARIEHPMGVQFDSTVGDRLVTPLADVRAWVDEIAATR